MGGSRLKRLYEKCIYIYSHCSLIKRSPKKPKLVKGEVELNLHCEVLHLKAAWRGGSRLQPRGSLTGYAPLDP